MPSAGFDQPRLLQAGQPEVEHGVSSALGGQPVAEVGQDAVVEAGVVQFEREGVLEVDATADCLCRLPVRQVQQELQDTYGGELGGR